jgi:outer membrane protein X
MKKPFTLAVLITVAFLTNAQTEKTRMYKPFKVDISAGFALPLGGEGTKAGGVFAIEPKYAIVDAFALGFRLEGAALARVVSSNGVDYTGDAVANASYLLTGDFYLSNHNMRPFVGAGTGSFEIAAADINQPLPDVIPTEHKFGFMIRGGFEVSHFRLGVEYNIVGSTDLSPHNNYIGFKIGGFFGGGKYKK